MSYCHTKETCCFAKLFSVKSFFVNRIQATIVLWYMPLCYLCHSMFDVFSLDWIRTYEYIYISHTQHSHLNYTAPPQYKVSGYNPGLHVYLYIIHNVTFNFLKEVNCLWILKYAVQDGIACSRHGYKLLSAKISLNQLGVVHTAVTGGESIILRRVQQSSSSWWPAWKAKMTEDRSCGRLLKQAFKCWQMCLTESTLVQYADTTWYFCEEV